jgi:hypothetical protein
MTDRTPTTQAGKRLLDNRDFHDPECPRWKAIGSPDAPCSCDLPKAVSRVEAELVNAYRSGALIESGEPASEPRFDVSELREVLERMSANAVRPDEYEDYYLVRRADFHEMEDALAVPPCPCYGLRHLS